MVVEFVYDSFLGIDPQDASYDDSSVALVRAPYDGTTSYQAGARHGPDALLSASKQVELYDRELDRIPADCGIYTLPSFLPSSALGPKQVIDEVESICTKPVKDGKFVFLVGGEHSLSLGAVKAYAETFDSFSVLQIDAHLDLRPSYEGSAYSHACVAHQILPYTDNLVQVGVRTACPEEMDIIKAKKLAPIWGEECAAEPDEKWIARAISGLGDKVYVTLDVDGLDPSVIPGTGTPVPGGLGWYQTLKLLRAIGQSREVIGCDIMELAPMEGDRRSAYAAALLAYKMIGYFVKK